MKFDSTKFRVWYGDHIGKVDGGVPAGTWVAIDQNQAIVDQDGDSNQLLERVEKTQPNPSIIRIVYSFPREFV